MTRRRTLLLTALCAAFLLAPGWRGGLQVAPHDDVLAAARAAAPDTVFGVARPGERDGETWHAQYHDDLPARTLRSAGMGVALTRLLPPAFVAHVPVGAERADGYFRVRTSLHWPWWRPGGGVDWRDPRVAAPSDGE